MLLLFCACYTDGIEKFNSSLICIASGALSLNIEYYIRVCQQKLLMHTWVESNAQNRRATNKAKNLFIVYSTKKWIFQSMFKICINLMPTRILHIKSGHKLDPEFIERQ